MFDLVFNSLWRVIDSFKCRFDCSALCSRRRRRFRCVWRSCKWFLSSLLGCNGKFYDFLKNFVDQYHLDEDPFSAIEVINIEIHEDYNDTQVHNDIALLQLKDDVNSTMYNMITLLNGTGMIDMESYEGSLSVAGWGVVDNKVGAEESRILLETTVDFQSPDYCDNYLNSEGFLTRFTLADYDNTGKICTVGNGTGICAGDRYSRDNLISQV